MSDDQWDSFDGHALALVLPHPFFTPLHSFRTPCHSIIPAFLSFVNVFPLRFPLHASVALPPRQQPKRCLRSSISALHRRRVACAFSRRRSSIRSFVERTASIASAETQLGRIPKWCGVCSSLAPRQPCDARSETLTSARVALSFCRRRRSKTSANKIRPHHPAHLSTSGKALTNGRTDRHRRVFVKTSVLLLTY